MELGRETGSAQLNSQNIQESEQMITTEEQIMPSGKERMILLFNWTILQEDRHFVKEFFSFESQINNDQSQRSITEETEKKR